MRGIPWGSCVPLSRSAVLRGISWPICYIMLTGSLQGMGRVLSVTDIMKFSGEGGRLLRFPSAAIIIATKVC